MPKATISGFFLSFFSITYTLNKSIHNLILHKSNLKLRKCNKNITTKTNNYYLQTGKHVAQQIKSRSTIIKVHSELFTCAPTHRFCNIMYTV